MQVIIVDEESETRRVVRLALGREGIAAFEARTAEQARLEIGTRRPDLIVIDLSLPDCDGKALIREVRTWSSVPIVVLSARDQEVEKVEALEAGADDYLVKPFGFPELLARIRAQIRRSTVFSGGFKAAPIIRFGDVAVDISTHETRLNGDLVHLTPMEYRLLAALIRGRGNIVPHSTLLHEVWGPEYINKPHYLRIYMSHLRQKLEENPNKPRHLITALQFGYRIDGLVNCEVAPYN